MKIDQHDHIIHMFSELARQSALQRNKRGSEQIKSEEFLQITFGFWRTALRRGNSARNDSLFSSPESLFF
jgi:hypothetical protein